MREELTKKVDRAIKLILQFVERMICAPNGDFEAAGSKGSAVAYAWYIWEVGWKGKTEMDWLV